MANPNPKRENLQKGGGPGRPPGQPNKITRILKEAILQAAANVGKDGRGKGELVGYLERIAIQQPKAFCVLLGKVLPLQVNLKEEQPDTRTYRTVEEVQQALAERGIPLILTEVPMVLPAPRSADKPN